ncbi:hypothetical protein [Mesorhizobium sp. M1406]|uniref:hypothetical protein n=1 Tax=Mesorhizobium sp. M1406 TaxID=2957099 RepID=UPI0033382111
MDGDWDWAIPALSRTMQGEQILQPEEVAAMLRRHEVGGEPTGKGIRVRAQHEALRVALVVHRNLLKVWRRKPVRALAAGHDDVALPNLQPDGVVDPLH